MQSCWVELEPGLDDGGRRLGAASEGPASRRFWRRASEAHALTGLKFVFSGHYEGEHWLATFRGLLPDRPWTVETSPRMTIALPSGRALATARHRRRRALPGGQPAHVDDRASGEHARVCHLQPPGWLVLMEGTRADHAVKIVFIFWQAHLQAFFKGLLFFLAGVFAHRSLERRGSGKFLRERGRRLGLPSLLYVLLIHPIMVYVLLGYPQRAGSGPRSLCFT